ncbi:MAG: primase [Gemmatimonadales bacterium]|nr:primase [Gemmatimonadales bacterium]
MTQKAEAAPLTTGPLQVRSPAKGSNMSSIRDKAVSLAGRGWAVFPCRPSDKRPAVPEWDRRACSDPATAGRYWPSPRHNIGVACGPSGLVVVDLDTPAHGGTLPEEWRIPGVVEGADVLAVLVERLGREWPHTYMVRTPSFGTHLYYLKPEGREIRNSAGKVGPMIDVRAAGGYVVGAGSVTSVGVYEVLIDSAPAPLPGWLADLADPPRSVRSLSTQAAPRAEVSGRPRSRFVALLDTLLNAPIGQRNNVLHWAACRAGDMVQEGQVEQYAAYTALTQAAESIGLGEQESRATITSAFGRAA